MQELLRQLIADSLATPVPLHTRRDARLPAIPGKAVAVVGMRRSGKTTFLWQCLADRLVGSGVPREALLHLNFEDERLADLQGRRIYSGSWKSITGWCRSSGIVVESTFFFDRDSDCSRLGEPLRGD